MNNRKYTLTDKQIEKLLYMKRRTLAILMLVLFMVGVMAVFCYYYTSVPRCQEMEKQAIQRCMEICQPSGKILLPINATERASMISYGNISVAR